MNVTVIIMLVADILTIIAHLRDWRWGSLIPLHVLTFFLGVGLASAAFIWLPYFRKKRLVEKYKQKQAARRLKHLLDNIEFMKRFHYEKSPQSDISLLCNESGDLVCPECAKNNQEVVLPRPGYHDNCVVCPRCGDIVRFRY